ncbi:MAG TPA: magnesium and cobalt transport protein CorA, partial [Woeseiaceae bacterium]|nr:magnesium and cobalt transport protein CorA [Woeseiaceae bacterium]
MPHGRAMPIVAARRYTAGKPAAEPLVIVPGTCRVPPPQDSFDWVGVAEPTAEEMELLQALFGLHPLAVEDSLNPKQLPKVEGYGQRLFVVARTTTLADDDIIDFGQTAFFVAEDFIVSVRHGSNRAHLTLRQHLEQIPDRLDEGPDFVLHAILDFIVDGYLETIKPLERVVAAMEERAIDVFPDQETIRRLFRLRRQVRRFQRIIAPMEGVCLRLTEADLPAIDASARPWFRDVLDHVRRALSRLNGLQDTMATIVETASLLEQHRQGEMTRKLAAWAAILAV